MTPAFGVLCQHGGRGVQEMLGRRAGMSQLLLSLFHHCHLSGGVWGPHGSFSPCCEPAPTVPNVSANDEQKLLLSPSITP